MAERRPSPKTVDRLTDELFRSPYSMRAREYLSEQYLYQLTVIDRFGSEEVKGSPFNIDEELIAVSGVEPDHDWLDLGCGDARLIELLSDRGHNGMLVGVEKNPLLYHRAEMALADRANVKFLWGDIRHLDKDDPNRQDEPIENQFDICSAAFCLNHVGHPKLALEQAGKRLKPNGRFLAALRDNQHHWQIWQKLMPPIAEQLKKMQTEGRTDQDPKIKKDYLKHPPLRAPSQHYHHFDFVRGERDIAAEFRILDRRTYLGELHIPLPGMSVDEGWQDLKLVLVSLQSSFRPRHKAPPISDLGPAIEEAARPIYEEEVDEHGYFRVDTKEAIWLCTHKLGYILALG